MTEQDPTNTSPERALPQQKPLYILDVDLTIYDCFAEPRRLMPGARLLVESLSSLGEVRLWSAGGEDYARKIATDFDLTEFISDYHDKPTYPPKEEDALRILGRVAALQIDDDETERIGDWNFKLATNNYDLE